MIRNLWISHYKLIKIMSKVVVAIDGKSVITVPQTLSVDSIGFK